jgi:predicted lipoprotein
MRSCLYRGVVLFAVALSGAAGCKIKYDGDLSGPSAGAGAFNAKDYVGGIWDMKVLPLLKEKPTDVETIVAAIAKDPDGAGKQYGHRAGDGQPWTYLVKGEGKVKSVDVASRHGTMVVDTDKGGQAIEVVLQIGPVVFGTALRDALPFVSFGDFVNQIDYAEVSRVLNDKAISAARGSLDFTHAAGRTVTFAGAATAPSEGNPLTVTPASLSLGGDSGT